MAIAAVARALSEIPNNKREQIFFFPCYLSCTWDACDLVVPFSPILVSVSVCGLCSQRSGLRGPLFCRVKNCCCLLFFIWQKKNRRLPFFLVRGARQVRPDRLLRLPSFVAFALPPLGIQLGGVGSPQQHIDRRVAGYDLDLPDLGILGDDLTE